MEQARERQRQFEETQRRWQEQMQMGATSNNATAEVRNGDSEENGNITLLFILQVQTQT